MKKKAKVKFGGVELGPVKEGWERKLEGNKLIYKQLGGLDKPKDGKKAKAELGKKIQAKLDEGPKTFQFNIELKDNVELAKLKEELTRVELQLMRHARDLSTGVVDQKDVLVARFLDASFLVADILEDCESAWEKGFKVPGLEEARVAEKVK